LLVVEVVVQNFLGVEVQEDSVLVLVIQLHQQLLIQLQLALVVQAQQFIKLMVQMELHR
jgi:hypothetical protein